MRPPSLDRVAFLTSLVFFAFVYGIATQAFGWFPSSLFQEAWNQAEAIAPISTGRLTGGQRAQWTTSRVYDRSGVTHPSPDRTQPGLTLISSAWNVSGEWGPGLRLIDRDGDVVHQWTIRPEEVFPDTTASPRGPLSQQDIQGMYLFPSGDVLVNVEYVGAARLDACSRAIWRNSRFNFHHSVARDTDGSFWIPGVIRNVDPRSSQFPDGYPGLQGPIHRSLIVHLAQDGTVVDTIDVLEVLYRNGLQRHIPQATLDRLNESLEQPFGRDVVHMNDIEPLPDSIAGEYPLFEAGDLVVSLRQPNLVFVVDPVSDSVKWHASHPFSHQHDPDFVGDGWIGVFDNNHDWTSRGQMSGGSRVVLLQPHTDSMRVPFPTERSDPLYTNVRGKWQMLGNGNFLITESQAGRVVEVAPDGSTVWEWIQEPSGENTVPSVTEGTRVAYDRDRVATWPCAGGGTADSVGGSGSRSQ